MDTVVQASSHSRSRSHSIGFTDCTENKTNMVAAALSSLADARPSNSEARSGAWFHNIDPKDRDTYSHMKGFVASVWRPANITFEPDP